MSNNPLKYTDPTGHWQDGDENLSLDVQIQISQLTTDYGNATSDSTRNSIHAQAELLRTLDKLFTDEFGFKEKLGQNTTVKAFDTIVKYNSQIDLVSDVLDVDKSMINAVMFREMRCFALDDNFDTLKLKIRGDASIGLGQIFVSTAQNSERLVMGDDALSYTKSQMVDRLLDGRTNIYYIGIVLKANAINLNADASDASASILARYNGTGAAAQNYGKQAYQYSLAFRQYFMR